MQKRSTLPDMPGYYWRRGYNQDIELVMQVVRVDVMVSSQPEDLFYWEAGELGGIFIKDEIEVEWYGPIAEPGTNEIVNMDFAAMEQRLFKALEKTNTAVLSQPNGSYIIARADGLRIDGHSQLVVFDVRSDFNARVSVMDYAKRTLNREYAQQLQDLLKRNAE